MTLKPDLALVEKAIDQLERREVRVLVWGLVDSALSSEEVDGTLRDILNENQDLAAHSDCTASKRIRTLSSQGMTSGRSGSPWRSSTRLVSKDSNWAASAGRSSLPASQAMR